MGRTHGFRTRKLAAATRTAWMLHAMTGQPTARGAHSRSTQTTQAHLNRRASRILGHKVPVGAYGANISSRHAQTRAPMHMTTRVMMAGLGPSSISVHWDPTVLTCSPNTHAPPLTMYERWHDCLTSEHGRFCTCAQVPTAAMEADPDGNCLEVQIMGNHPPPHRLHRRLCHRHHLRGASAGRTHGFRTRKLAAATRTAWMLHAMTGQPTARGAHSRSTQTTQAHLNRRASRILGHRLSAIPRENARARLATRSRFCTCTVVPK